jgi:hypothetical protein
MGKKPKDRHLDAPAEANRDKHINFVADENREADPATMPSTGALSENTVNKKAKNKKAK